MQSDTNLEPHTPSASLSALGVGLFSQDPQAQFEAARQVRELLEADAQPPIDEVIQLGVLPRFAHFLKEPSQPDLQFEAACVFAKIASGTAEQAQGVVEVGALPLLVQLLAVPREDIRERAMCVLGTLASDSPPLRDLLLQSGCLGAVLPLLNLSGSESIDALRNAAWVLASLCRGKPPPRWQWVSPALATLAHLLERKELDDEVLADACWTLAHMSDGPQDQIADIIQSGLCPRLIELLGHPSRCVQTPALRSVGNLIARDDQHTDVILAGGLLHHLKPLLFHKQKAMKREACWVTSNLTAGTCEQIEAVINAGLIPALIHLLDNADADIKAQAAWAISNAASGASPQQISYLVECHCIESLLQWLTVSNTKTTGAMLGALGNILKAGRQTQQETDLTQNPYCRLLEQAGGLEGLRLLQENPDQEIGQKAADILQNYFPS